MAEADQSSIGEDVRKQGTRILDLEKALEYYTEHVVQLEKQISKCMQNESNTAPSLVRLESNYASLHNYTKSLEDYCLVLDIGSHKKYLLLTGIPETEEENRSKNKVAAGDLTGTDNPEIINENEDDGSLNPTHELVLSSLSNIQDTILYDDIDVACRIGRKKGSTPRPILIKFVRESC